MKERMATPVHLMTAECALGNILLRLHHTIAYQFAEYVDPATLWAKLLEKYGVPRLSKNYVDFKTIMDLKIHNNTDPSPAFDQLAALFSHLKQNGLEIPKKLAVMIILSKMPPVYEVMVQMCVLAGEDAAQDPNQIMGRFRSAYDTGNRVGGSNKPQHANKLSTVKPAPNQPPHFQQQQ
jgi:hypothetical protein